MEGICGRGAATRFARDRASFPTLVPRIGALAPAAFLQCVRRGGIAGTAGRVAAGMVCLAPSCAHGRSRIGKWIHPLRTCLAAALARSDSSLAGVAAIRRADGDDSQRVGDGRESPAIRDRTRSPFRGQDSRHPISPRVCAATNRTCRSPVAYPLSRRASRLSSGRGNVPHVGDCLPGRLANQP